MEAHSSQLPRRRQSAVPSTIVTADSESRSRPLQSSSDQELAIVPWSPSLEAVLDRPPSRLPQRFALLGGLFVTALGIWAWTGHFNEVGHAQGKLVPQGEIYKIHASQPGKILSLAVQEGHSVQQGELLAVLANDLAKEEVQRLEQNLQSIGLQVAQQQILLENLRLEGQGQLAIAATELRSRQSTLEQAQLKVQNLQAIIQRSGQALAPHGQRLERLKLLVETGALAREQIFQVEQDIYDRQTALLQHQGQLIQARKEVEQLRSLWQQQAAEKQQIKLAAQRKMQNVSLQILQLQSQFNNEKAQLTSARTHLKQHFLYAPTQGTISSLKIKNEGEVLQPGQTLLEMHSHHDPLVLEAMLTSREAGFIEPGMAVKVKFDAYPYQKFGVMPGTVIFTSPDSETSPQLGTIYRLKIALEHDHIVSNQQKIELKAGQTATADIIIRRRRILDLLLEPLQQLREDIREDIREDMV